MSWIEIDTGVYALETENPVQVVVISDLEAEKGSFESLRNTIADDFEHVDKAYEAYVNTDREKLRDLYTQRIVDIDDILKEING